MIIRIVKLEFKSEEIDNFKTIFDTYKEAIRNFPGCNHLQLLQEKNNPQIFMTYSFWDKEESLNSYRHSDLFKGVWSKTKVLFSAKPEAWSMEKKAELL